MAASFRIAPIPSIAAILLLPLGFGLLLLAGNLGSGVDQPGSYDFIQYWTAFQLFIEGNNPYDAVSLHALQRELGRMDDVPLMMWNPPWILVLLAPLLSLPFETAVFVWLVLNAALFIAAIIATLAWQQSKSISLLPLLLVSLSFYPAWDCLLMGQVSLLLAASAASALLCLRHRKDFIAGCLLLPLTLKPHLVYLPAAVLAVWLVRHRRWKVILSFLGGAVLLLAACWCIAPESVASWFTELASERASRVAVRQWQPATVAGWLRAWTIEIGIDIWPYAWIFPLCCVVAVLLLLRPNGNDTLREEMPMVIALSVATALYGWIFDMALLIVVEISLLAIVQRRHRQQLLPAACALSAINLLAAVLQQGVFHEHRYFAWFPWAVLGLWLFWHNQFAAKAIAARE